MRDAELPDPRAWPAPGAASVGAARLHAAALAAIDAGTQNAATAADAEGTATIEAEVKGVAFTDEGGTKNDLYWSNMDLVPDVRPKGGLKAKGKKK